MQVSESDDENLVSDTIEPRNDGWGDGKADIFLVKEKLICAIQSTSRSDQFRQSAKKPP